MYESLLKPNNTGYQYYDDIEIYTEDINEAISCFDVYSSYILVENATFNLNMEEIIGEAVFKYDTELLVFLNEGIIGATFNSIKKLIGAAFIFLKKLLGKVNLFIDQYTASNIKWYNTYASRVKAKINVARGFTYEGHEWNMAYMTGKPYPDVSTELAKQSDVIAKAAREYTTLLQGHDLKGEDFKRIEDDLIKAYPDGFKAEAKERYEKKLKCKVEEISNHYYNLGSGGEVKSIAAFKSVSIETMLNHIKDSHILLEEVQSSMTTMVEKINKIVAVIDKIDMDDLETKIAKATNNEKAVNESVGLLNEKVSSSGKAAAQQTAEKIKIEKANPPAKKPNPEDNASSDTYGDKGSITAAANAIEPEKPEEKDQETEEEVKAEKGSAAIEYTKTLRAVLNDSVATWQLTFSIANKLSGTRTSVIKDANREFIKVLSKFISTNKTEGA